ncbi:MAG: RRXRR domain-containing protein [Candidatus Schekmanbacteria bacterium]|nr:RRXRR domain-containing protein [Candidatus Schekmanbacteria bacterium]
MVNRALVLDSERKPLMPCHPARVRRLLRDGKAAVFRREPFTIILRERVGGETQPIEVKLDPGSKTTGIALVARGKRGRKVVLAAEITHRSGEIRDAMTKRRALRQGRRYRKVRHRAPRFLNRRRPEGWLPPSLESRVRQVETWARRLARFTPVTAVEVETARFDTHVLSVGYDLEGVEFQRGTLFGWELREYVFHRDGHRCRYCGGESGVPVLELEHGIPKARGGSDRVANLVTACRACNQAKGNRTATEWAEALAGSPTKLDRVRRAYATKVAVGKHPSLRDAAAINATRYAIGDRLKTLGIPVGFRTGGRTKMNRTTQGYPKRHWIDAACVGETAHRVRLDPGMTILRIRARGHGTRKRCGTDAHGFPIRHAPRAKRFLGFATGDLVRAVIPVGKYRGIHVGRIAIRHRPSFKLARFDVHPKYLALLQRADGYEYA